MTEKPDAAKVSLSKSVEPEDPPAPRPRSVLFGAVALALAGVAALIASVDLYGLRDWLTSEQVKADNKAKPVKHHTAAQLHHLVNQQQSSVLIGSIIAMVAVCFLGYGVYRGRHWSRWAVIGFWFLASFTGTLVGIGAVFNVGSSAPAAFRVPAFLAGAAMIIAVILVNLRPSTEYFAAHRPAPVPGAPARRGLFAPRAPIGMSGPAASRSGTSKARAALTSNAAVRGEAYVQRQRAKRRAADNAESVARGAELARQRAKASKSRRVES